MLYSICVSTSLEQNRALQLEFQGMLWKLGQQRMWYRLGETGMRNAERAKEDTERKMKRSKEQWRSSLEPLGKCTGGNKQECVTGRWS